MPDATSGGREPLRLDGRHVVVCGVTSVLGRPIAVGLAEAGATVSVTTRHAGDPAETAAAHSVLNECWTLGGEGRVLELDLTDHDAVAAALRELEGVLAPLDALVYAPHEAPPGAIGPFETVMSSAWDALFEANVAGAVNMLQAAGPAMASRGSGRIVVPVSLLAERGAPHMAAVAAAQGALLALVRSLAIEWAPRGVTVNAIGLGHIEGVPGPLDDAELRERVERYVPLRRLGRTTDIVGGVRYLVSEEAAFMTGQLLLVDGALSVRV